MKQITEEQLEALGRLADKADNYRAATKLRVPPAIHVEGLSGGMLDIRDELRKLVIEIGGENPWADQPLEEA